jgi:type VII secretion protein EccE
VAAEVVAVALVLAALSGPAGWLLGLPVAGALAALGFGRWRGRWLFRWVGIALRHGSRPRALPPGAGAADLLTLVEPGARVVGAELGGRGYGLVEDEYGVTAVLELGDPATLLSDAPLAVPSPVALLAGPDVRVQLLVAGAPAPALRAAAGIPGTSYRQLTEGRLPAYQRALLAARVLRDGRSDDDLRRTLASALRRLRRRLDKEQVPHRPLGTDATLAALAELAHHHPGAPVRESWSSLDAGGLRQATVRVTRLAGLRPELAGQLVPRLLGLPAVGTTVSLAAAPPGAELVVRLAAPDPVALGTALQALRRLLGAAGLGAVRLDGEHLLGLAATLPLGRVACRSGHQSAFVGRVACRSGHQSAFVGRVACRSGHQSAFVGRVGEPGPAGALSGARSELPGAGLMLGRNRKGWPVLARVVRAEPTRALLVGGVRVAEMLTLRALALGVHVLVHTGRPYAWEPFLRAVSLPSDAIALVPFDRPVALPPAGPLAPQLVVVDVGPPGSQPLPGEAGWRTTLVVRDDLAEADLDAVARADLVVLQPLHPDEAALAGAVLGLGAGQEWLARIRGDMVGVVNRRAVRFAQLSPTPLEQQLIGSPERVAREPALGLDQQGGVSS